MSCVNTNLNYAKKHRLLFIEKRWALKHSKGDGRLVGFQDGVDESRCQFRVRDLV